MRQAKHTRARPAIVLVAVGILLGGCGSSSRYANNPRPPAPIVVTAAISSDHISVSPTHFGAGPIELVVTNLTNSSQQLTLETDQINGSSAGLRQQTGPINPQDTASLKASVTRGSYSVHVDGSRIKAASLNVGTARASAQNQLLQP